jgi:hypothetical protein
VEGLRMVAIAENGAYIVLSPTGSTSRLRLYIDDHVRTAICGQPTHKDRHAMPRESSVRPKEIQARIRAGETAEEIAAKTGLPVELIRRFEGPILQERKYVADRSRLAIVDLGTGVPNRLPFQTMLDEYISASDSRTNSIEWNAIKRSDDTWLITVSLHNLGEQMSSEWAFDVHRNRITPADTSANQMIALHLGRSVHDHSIQGNAPRACMSGSALESEGGQAATSHVEAGAAEPELGMHMLASNNDTPLVEKAEQGTNTASTVKSDAIIKLSQSGPPVQGRGRRIPAPSWDELMFGPGPEK